MVGSTAGRTTSVRVGSSFALPEVIRSLGHSPQAVFGDAGVDLELYSHPENRIETVELGRLFDVAAKTTARPDIGLLVVSRFQPPGLGLVGLVAAEGPDVRTALLNLVRLLPHNTLAGYPVLSATGETAMLKFDLRYADFLGAGFILEGATGIILRFLQWLCGPRWRPEIVHLSRRKPSNPKPFSDFFCSPVRFSSTEDAVLFSSSWLSSKVAREKDRLQQKKLEIAAAPFSELVRRQVVMRVGLEPLSAEHLASQLGLSRRQLFRYLKDEGTTCKSLIDDVKHARARYLLTAGAAPLADIAFALGYPDPSSFTRAFTRWAGMAPSDWRRRQQVLGE